MPMILDIELKKTTVESLGIGSSNMLPHQIVYLEELTIANITEDDIKINGKNITA